MILLSKRGWDLAGDPVRINVADGITLGVYQQNSLSQMQAPRGAGATHLLLACRKIQGNRCRDGKRKSNRKGTNKSHSRDDQPSQATLYDKQKDKHQDGKFGTGTLIWHNLANSTKVVMVEGLSNDACQLANWPEQAGLCEFCNWMLSQPDGFEQKVVFSDKKWFCLHPSPNSQTDRIWTPWHPNKEVVRRIKSHDVGSKRRQQGSRDLLDDQQQWASGFCHHQSLPHNNEGASLAGNSDLSSAKRMVVATGWLYIAHGKWHHQQWKHKRHDASFWSLASTSTERSWWHFSVGCIPLQTLQRSIDCTFYLSLVRASL